MKMSKLVLNKKFNLYERNNQVYCSSRQVAEEFDRQHAHILRLIDELTQSTSGFSAEFISLNFEAGKYKDGSGKWNKEYLLTKDGFTALTMEIKSKRARQFKEVYIRRFNEMEQYIKSRHIARLESRELTDAVQLLHDPAMHYHYSNEFDMINRIVLGMSSKQFRLQHGIPKDEPIRERLTLQEIDAIQKLQAFDAHLAKVFPDYRQRQGLLREYYSKISTPAACQLTGS
jgi:Rha family phage regulatory protein